MDDPLNPVEVTWLTANVAITNYKSAHSKMVLSGHDVKAILCLDRDLEGCPAGDRGVECISVVPLKDGANEMVVFRETVITLEKLVDHYLRVVVHCRAGRSRSIAVVAAYLMKTRNMEAEEAMEYVKAKRQSAIAPELIRLVERFEP